MDTRMKPCLPLPLDPVILEEIVSKAKDFALMHGVCMRSKTNFSTDSLNFAPFALLPSVFPRREFERAVAIQTVINELIHRVAHNHEFLQDCLKYTIEVDDFTGRLYKLYETVRKEGFTQPISLGCVRSDIMLESQCCCCIKENCHPHCCKPESPFCCWKQVEVNTIASGFGWLGPASGLIQRLLQCISLGLLRSDYLAESSEANKVKQVEVNTIASSLAGISTILVTVQSFILEELGHREMVANLPENIALQGLCGGMIEAWKMYDNPKSVIMFVIENITYNICDQKFHEYEIRKMNPNVRVIRRTLTQIADTAKIGPNKELFVGNEIVAVVYFRAGYEPGHYPTEREWDARLLIERSLAIKCPSIHYHLAGTKKVQQALARPGALNKFLEGDDKINKIQDIFTGLYSLDFDEFGDAAVQMAIEQPERFVLKPQREGGGNNVYGEQIRDVLKTMKDSKERTAWILMDRILPPVQANYVVRPGNPVVDPVDLVSELGIFGVVIGTEKEIFTNKQVGHMLRSKLSSANEGGVAAGAGALDSPYLI